MFDTVRLLLEEEESSFVIVLIGTLLFILLILLLIDEVESISASRNLSLNSNEPSDSIRVVNALLTQLDTFKNIPNILILATSNITNAVDSAFIDRADLVIHVERMGWKSLRLVLIDCLNELMRVDLIEKVNPSNLN